jgi:hypothetical protein
MYCLQDMGDEKLEAIRDYLDRIGPQPYVETRQDGYYFVWENEVRGPYPTADIAFNANGVATVVV